MLDIQMRGAEDLRKMARALREADKVGLGRELGKAIKDAAKPTERAIQESARNFQTHGVRRPGARRPFTRAMPSKGTRARIANAVKAEVRINEENPRVRFSVKNSQLPENLKGMPSKFDSPTPWRHPVLGNRNAWVSQTGSSWFWPPIRDRIKLFRAELDKALDRTREKLERS